MRSAAPECFLSLKDGLKFYRVETKSRSRASLTSPIIIKSSDLKLRSQPNSRPVPMRCGRKVKSQGFVGWLTQPPTTRSDLSFSSHHWKRVPT
ncbi:hypothetical protein AVEN_130212-1 [Araneus ventricosus]|uniref:Uncharacterized protein n=1 Tax=Araneus ventricosus TaxID=182803 RepID=A0A4Y2GFM9_ARAVE|nr:hypothetical protein AVEN_130212-1 [Araneus ventricosus]